MKRSLRRIGLSASLAATMALAGAGPALAGHSPLHPTKSQGQGPKLITGNPGKGATVIHCKRLAPGVANGVIVITPKGKVNNNCKGLPAMLPAPLPANLEQLLRGLPEAVKGQLPPVLRLPALPLP
jgi:hypothetical protein